jgi:hypothetical protein
MTGSVCVVLPLLALLGVGTTSNAVGNVPATTTSIAPATTTPMPTTHPGTTVPLATNVPSTPAVATTTAPAPAPAPTRTSTPVTTIVPATTAPRATIRPRATVRPPGTRTAPAEVTTTTLGDPAELNAARPAPAYVGHPVGARQLAAAYAFDWSLGTNPNFALYYGGKISIPSDNPLAFGRAIDTTNQGELDCTAFMSQALRASGFPYAPSWNYNPVRHSASTSWLRASGPEGLSATFIKLGRMRLVSPVGTRRGEPPPPGIQIGDIVVWDLNARPKRVVIDHQLMVTEVSGTGTSWADIRVSYHTYDHRNRALDEYQNYVAQDAPSARLYVFHVNYPS